MAAGSYTVVAYAHNALTQQFDVAKSARITVTPPVSKPFISVDTPAAGATVTSAFEVGGWALDAGAPSGTGVDAVHFYVFPNDGASPGVFIGIGSYGLSRPDVGAIFGSRFTNSGYHFTITGLGPGAYLLGVYARSTVTGTFSIVRTLHFTVSATPLMSIDTPAAEATITTPTFNVAGWSIDRAVESTAQSGTGVDTLHVYAYPNPGSGQAPIFLGVATVGFARPDVAAVYGSRYANAGYTLGRRSRRARARARRLQHRRRLAQRRDRHVQQLRRRARDAAVTRALTSRRRTERSVGSALRQARTLRQQQLDRVGQVLVGDVVVAAAHPQRVRLHQHVDVTEPLRRFELIAGQFDLQAIRIAEVDRIHEAAVALDELDAALAKPRRGVREGRPRHVERDVLDAAGLARRVPPGVRARLAGEDRQQTAVARIEIEMVLVGLAKVGLLEHEGHAQRALPEVDGALLRGSDEGDVMDSLDLNLLFHGAPARLSDWERGEV